MVLPAHNRERNDGPRAEPCLEADAMARLECLRECAGLYVVHPLGKPMLNDLVIVIPPEPLATFLAEVTAWRTDAQTGTSSWWSDRLPNCL